jgi:hypothetical protein
MKQDAFISIYFQFDLLNSTQKYTKHIENASKVATTISKNNTPEKNCMCCSAAAVRSALSQGVEYMKCQI